MESSKSFPEKLNAVEGKQQLDEILQMKNISYDMTVSRKYPPLKIYWGRILFYTAIHTGAIYGLQLCFTTTKWATLAWGKFL